MRTVVAVIVAPVAFLAVGCGSVIAPVATSPPATPASTAASRCPTPTDLGAFPPDQAAEGSLPPDFVPTSVIQCDVVSKPFAGEGVWSVLQEREAGWGIDALVAAMRLPSQPTPAVWGCDDVLVVVPWFGFLDASGRLLRVDVPRDACGKPLPAVLNAFRALAFTTIHETRLHQEQTPEQAALEARATALGCVSQFKDMIAITEGDPGQPSTVQRPVLGAGQVPTVICRYAAAADAQGMPLLTFVSGHRPSVAQASQVAATLRKTGAVRPCSTRHTLGRRPVHRGQRLRPDRGRWVPPRPGWLVGVAAGRRSTDRGPVLIRTVDARRLRRGGAGVDGTLVSR